MNDTVKTPFEMVTHQFKELLTQNDIHYSIIAMNKYIQSPKYFQVVYNVKRKLKFIMKSHKNVLRKEITTNKDNVNNKMLQIRKGANNNEIPTKLLNTRNLMFAVVCVGTCVWVYHKRKETHDLKRRVRDIEREKQLLLFQNKELLNQIRNKH